MLDNPDFIATVQQLDTVEFSFLAALASLACIGGAVLAVLMLKRRRLIADLPTSRIRSAAQGYVELEGHAQLLPGDPITAPLSRRPCVWWRYSVERKESRYINGRRETRWETIESGRSDSLFQLYDDSGDCVVDPEGAKITPNISLSWYGHQMRPSSAPEKKRLFSLGLGNYRYRESRIEPNSALYALGWFRTEGGVAHDFDEQKAVGELLREWKQDQAQLLKEFDQDGDGQIDLQEWEAVRERALEQVRARHLQQASDPDLHILCRPPRRQDFILSTIPQAELLSRYSRRSLLGLVLFFLGGGAGIWLLTARGLL